MDRSSDPSPLFHVAAVAILAAVATLASVALLAAVAAALGCSCGCTWLQLRFDSGGFLGRLLVRSGKRNT